MIFTRRTGEYLLGPLGHEIKTCQLLLRRADGTGNARGLSPFSMGGRD